MRCRHQSAAVLGQDPSVSTLAAVDGFAETFSWFIMGVAPGGGSEKPELDPAAEGVLFVVEGELTLAGERYRILPGG